MGLPNVDPTAATVPAKRRRWRPGLALGVAGMVLWGHALLIEALAPAVPRQGSPLRSAAALQVRLLAPAPAPSPAALPRPTAATTAAAVAPAIGSTPVRSPSPARRAVRTPAPVAAPSIDVAAALPVAPTETATLADPSAIESGAVPPPPIYPTRLPEPVQLRYALRYNGQAGEALLTWWHDGQRYTLDLDGASPAVGPLPVDGVARPLVAQASQGLLDAGGLAPERFVDRRRGGRQQAANFRRDIGRIGFSGPAVDYPAWPGAQDRLSWLPQLAAILAAGHAAPEIRLFVVDARGSGNLWLLQRQPDEALPTPWGEVPLQLWQRDPPRPEGLRVQAWLDATRGHWPVLLRFTAQRSGDLFELRLLAEPGGPAAAPPRPAP